MARPLLTREIAINIIGAPVPAVRKVYRNRLVWSKRYREWKDRAIAQIQAWMWAQATYFRRLLPLMLQPFVIDIDCVFPRPKQKPVLTVNKRRIPYPLPWTTERVPYLGRADWDNLAKGPGDALKAAGVIHDDQWFISGRCAKWYAAVGELAHTRIAFRPYVAA